MHMIYVDDSGQKQPRRQRLGELISVGGVIVPEPPSPDSRPLWMISGPT
ncbi:hypothetical protein [Actinomadura sp. NTSP31]